MKAKELREQALSAANTEYSEILKALQEAAQKGSLSAKFEQISDAAKILLKEKGYDVCNTCLPNGKFGCKVSFE